MRLDKERRREQILKVASEIFARRGYRRTDVQEIADRLKVGKGTIYRYFPTKEALFLAGVGATLERLADAAMESLEKAKNPVEGVRSLIEVFFEFCDKNTQFIEMVLTERAEFRDEFESSFRALERVRLKGLREIIIEGQKQRLFRKIDPDAVSMFLVTLLIGVFVSSVHTVAELKRSGKNIAEIFLKGILADKTVRKKR